jgi:hypothetical protein
MATDMNAVPNMFPPMSTSHDADRRRAPRFGAEGEVTVVLADDPQQQEIKAKLLDFSLHGLRVRLHRELPEGQEVRVYFSWGEVATQVVRTVESKKGYEIGLQLF